MTKIQLTKLDRRMTGYGDFKFMVKFLSQFDLAKFLEIRNWCWEQWGPSYEYYFHNHSKLPNKNPSWCWLINEFDSRIYFAGDEEASWFLLRWS